MLGFESGKSGTVKYFSYIRAVYCEVQICVLWNTELCTVKYFSYIRADSITSFWIPSMAICWMLSYACKICTYTTWGYYHQRICKKCWVLMSMTRCSEFQIESGTGSGYSWGLWIKTVTKTHIFFINKLSLFRLSDLGGGFDDAGWSSQNISTSSNGKLSVKVTFSDIRVVYHKQGWGWGRLSETMSPVFFVFNRMTTSL